MRVALELIANGYKLVEGPRTDAHGTLWFSDIFGGTVHRRTVDGELTTVVTDRTYVGGIAPHADGGVVMSGRSVVHWRDGSFRTLLEQPDNPHFNDLHTDAAGRVYVGAVRGQIKDVRQPPEPMGEAYRIEVDGSITELYGDVGISNGIGFSPDGRTLYHADSSSCGIWVHDIDTHGNVSNRRHIGASAFSTGIPDGLCVDVDGNLWVAHYLGGRVVKLSPDGTELDELAVPAERVTSCAFGGSDWADLYVVSADNTDDAELRGCVWRCRPGVTGVPTPLARV